MGLRRSRRRAEASKRWAFGLPYRRRAVPQASDCQMYKAVSGSGFPSLLWMQGVQSLKDITSCKQNLFFFFKNNAFLALIFFAFHSDAHILGKRASSKSGRAARLSPGGSSVLWVTRRQRAGLRAVQQPAAGSCFPTHRAAPDGLLTQLCTAAHLAACSALCCTDLLLVAQVSLCICLRYLLVIRKKNIFSLFILSV